MITRNRPAFSLLETMLFLAIVAIMSSTLVGVLIASQDARVRQQSIAALEQRGTQVILQITRRIRRSEAILTPAATRTGGILAVQSGLNSEFPTVFTVSGGNLLMVEKTAVSYVLPPNVKITNALFNHAETGSILLSFDLTITIPLIKAPTYTRHFESAVTVFADDQLEAGGCGTCPKPTCVAHKYRWYHCSSDVCTSSGTGAYLAC